LLAEVIEGEGDKQKNTAKAVKVRLKEIGRDPDYAEERQALEAYAALLDQQANAKARLKTAQDDLEAKLDAQYPRLTEADMRRLLNTYVQADPAADVGNLNSLSLTELIIETGIHDAIARRLNEKGRLSKNAIAEGIINNVRKPIIRDQLTDPRFYGEISQLLEDLIKQSRADAVAYEEFLRKAEDLVKRLAREQPDPDIPAVLHGNLEATVIFNNLPHILAAGCGGAIVTAEPLSDYGGERVRLALEIDRVMRERAPAGWKGDQTREAQVLNALFPILGRDREATLALFAIIKNLRGTDDREDHAWRDSHCSAAQGHQPCPSLRASTRWQGDPVGPNRNTSGGGAGLRDFQAWLDTGTAAAAGEAGTGNAPAIGQPRESLSLGTAVSHDGRATGGKTYGFTRPQAHHPDGTPGQ
jgi:broad specificity phosphatase PhoE